MPRWASRISLEIVSVKVERLQEISELDVRAEGIEPKRSPGLGLPVDYFGVFKRLWDSINGKKYPWVSDPWVFVIEFKRLDEMKMGEANEGN
jgi:hypothetical protein